MRPQDEEPQYAPKEMFLRVARENAIRWRETLDLLAQEETDEETVKEETGE